MKKKRLLIGSLMILGLAGCGPNYEEGAEFNFTENGDVVSFSTKDEIQEDYIGGRDGYGLEVDAGAVNGRLVLFWPANEVATYAGDSIKIERVTQVDFKEVEFASDPFFGECISNARIRITSVEYGLVSGEFSGNLCEDGIDRTGKLMNLEGTFSASLADGYWDG